MAFDIPKFNAAQHNSRTENVPVPELAMFFGPDDKQEFVVRNLSAYEYGRVIEAMQRENIENVRRLVSMVSTGDTTAIIEGLKNYLENTYNPEDGPIPADVVKRIYLLDHGIVEPKLTHQDVVKLATFHTEPFYRLSQKIMDLTALGAVPDLGE